MLYSTDASGAELQVKNELKHVFTGIFSRSRLLAYSDAIRAQMEAGTSTILYQQRALLDTNLLSNLPHYFEGNNTKITQSMHEIVTAIEHHYGGGFDYSFSMIENMREFININNPHPVTKVAAAIYLDHKIRNALGSQRNPDILSPFYEQAESIWSNFRSSKHTWMTIDRRDLTYAVLLKTHHLCWSKNSLTIEQALHELVEYCLCELGVIPLKELYFAWKAIIGFSTSYRLPVFDESPLKSPHKKSLARISALAWDLFIFRFTETLLTEGKDNTFYIPSITTLDRGLLNTIASCPVKAMISFPNIQYVETIFEDEQLFQICLNSATSKKQREIMEAPDRSLKGQRRLRHYISKSVHELEKSINKMIED